MINKSFVSVKLVSLRRVHVMVFTSVPRPSKVDFVLLVDDNSYHIKDYKQTSTNNFYIFDLELPFDYPFGKATTLNFTYFGTVPIDTSNIVELKEFDELFAYDGDDLGSHYTKEETKFTLWAPLATQVILKLENNQNEFEYHVMERTDKGVYRLTIKEDLLGRKYHYLVTNNGATRETNDPYEFSSSLNSEYSCVVDINKVKEIKNIKPTNEFNKYTDAFIYEVHVRDFTESKDTDIVHKGKYLGMIEKNRKSIYGDLVGLSHLLDLGVTHVQIQPILDFNHHDIYDYKKEYNWGYDPISTMGIEGQYSTNPNDPMSRLIEFKQMVEGFHENNIRLIVDVVYNHMYDYNKAAFEACVPNYFFRKRPNGTPAMASGCGNDFASERKMARKAIVDSALHLIDVFDIDGMRFDLMGLIDITTMKEVLSKARAIKKDFMVYGEGWNMGSELKLEEKAAQDNAFKLEEIGFFNDSYRDILKGPTFQDKIKVKGFINGDSSYTLGFVFSFLGSVTNFCYPKKYLSTNQSINYIECHDNNTVFDKLCASNENEDHSLLYKRVTLGNQLTILSFGVPFIHMGQEIGQSKFGLDNTYNIPRVNDFDLKGLSERKEMLRFIKEAVKLRYNQLSFLRNLTKEEELNNILEIKTINNLIYIRFLESKKYSQYEEIVFLINIYSSTIPFDLNEDYKVLLSDGVIIDDENIKVRSGVIGPASLMILVKK